MIKKIYTMYMGRILFLEYPSGTLYPELSSEIPAQDFNLLVNKDNSFSVFLLIIISTCNSFHLFKITFHLKNCLIGVTWGLSSKWCHNNLQAAVNSCTCTLVTIDKGLRKSTIGKSHCNLICLFSYFNSQTKISVTFLVFGKCL